MGATPSTSTRSDCWMTETTTTEATLDAEDDPFEVRLDRAGTRDAAHPTRP